MANLTILFGVWLGLAITLSSKKVQAAYYISLSPARNINDPDVLDPNVPTFSRSLADTGNKEKLGLGDLDNELRLVSLPSVVDTKDEKSGIGAHLMAIRPDYIFRNAANVLGSFFDLKKEKQIRSSRAGAYLTRKLRRSLLSSLRKDEFI
uniref:Uncharacterized protein n=1 Tax=Ditylenchus dipsaci TaxID=166011 RepID=A0A915D6M1_9BILA